MPDSTTFENILSLRPDYNALLWERNLRVTGVSAEKSQYYPYLTGHFVYNFSASSDKFDLDRQNSNYFVGVNLQIPIFTGGYTRAQIQIQQSQDDIYKNIKNIRLRLKEASSRIESAKMTRQSASRAFDISEKSVETGLTTQLELRDARVQFEMAVLNYYVATYDYLDAYYDWQLATGKVNTTSREPNEEEY
jgi:outer membrane protein TolC